MEQGRWVQAIMGRNFFGIEQWRKFYAVHSAMDISRQLSEFPWSADVLNGPCPFFPGMSVKDTHFAFLGLRSLRGRSLTCLRWYKIHQRRFDLDPTYWHRDQAYFAKKTCEFRWYLMLKEAMPNPEGRTYEEQIHLLPEDYEVPTVIEEVTKHVLYFVRNRIYVNKKRWSWCRDTDTWGNQIYVGGFNRDGLDIWWLKTPSGDITMGLGCSRKTIPTNC
jgi:hypothetical protein